MGEHLLKALIYTAALGSGILTFGTARGQIAEVRVGVSEFDETILDINWAESRADENSVGLNGEVIFDEPGILKWALTPQPYIGGMINLEGHTSYIGAGLLWRQSMGERLYADVSLGLAAHDGTNNLPPFMRGPDFAEFFERQENEIEFGSSLLFRTQLTLGLRVDENWASEIFYDHLSHAGLLDETDNDGVDVVGARIARRF